MGVIKTKNDNSQTALTWFLYFLLDTITMFSTIEATPEDGGGFPILFGSAVGSFIMFIIILYQKKIIWTWLETVITSLIIFCIVAWIIKGPYEAVAMGIISEIIVSIYLIIKTYRYPVFKYNLIGYILFLLASITTTLNAPDWSLTQIGYASSEIVLTTIIIIPLLIQFIKEKT